jgi:hypothetical protein
MAEGLTVEAVVSGLLDNLYADYRMLARAQTALERGVMLRVVTAEVASHLEMLNGIPEVVEADAVVGVPWAGKEADDG